MIKKKKPNQYISTTQETGHDTERDNKSITTPVRPAPEGRGVSPLQDQRQVGGLGEVPEKNTDVDRLGVDDNSGGGTRRFACITWIKSMISLPKVTGYALLLFIFVLAWYRLYPYDPIQFNSLPVPVLNENNEVRHGENLELYFDLFKEDGCQSVETTWFLVDGFVIQMNVGAGTLPAGLTQKSILVPMPTSAPVGENRHIKIEYSCEPNPVRRIEYIFETERFNILPSESGEQL